MEIQRPKYLNQIISVMHTSNIKVITGARRCGKSYLLFEIFKHYLHDCGIDEEHIIAIDLEDRRNKKYRDPDNLLEYIDSKMQDDKMYYILLDEVQMVAEFEDVLNSYIKVKNADVYVTGSNSKLLSKDIVTEFRGRSTEIRVHPLSFVEYLSASKNANAYDALREYMVYGGMPYTLTYERAEDKANYLKSLFRRVYLKDIQERYDIRNDNDLEELVDVIASSIGSLTNPTKLQNTFKTVKNSTLKDVTIKNYLGLLEDAFLIEKSVRYDIKGKKYISTPAKYYFEDLGLRNARLNFRQVEESHLMENLIYNELRMRGYSVDVGQVETFEKNSEGKTIRKNFEVDFVCNLGAKRFYIQSALDMPTPEKVEQETNSLLRVNDSFQKMIIVGGLAPSYINEDGIVIINIIDFLTKPESLNI
ncbi:ATP-binding protein [Leyella stercorea]|uniref:ATP-binding protein n=1 Tax=Leyella stercorea TaxID=363265 RepID=UPI00242F25A8|nr:ATP-binding protein [Leyella stercorea]